MPTPSPTDIPQPSDPTDTTPDAVESPATLILTQTDAGVQPAPKVWTPRPNDVLSPEDKDIEDLTDEELEALTAEGTSSGVFGGAFAIISAALGLASITGTWLGETIYQRHTLIGNIAASGKSPAIQVADIYVSPWHQMAKFNGMFALAAVLVGLVVLLAGQFLSAKPLPNWIKAVAVAGLALGVIGLGISCAMYFDWFTAAIKVPAATTG